MSNETLRKTSGSSGADRSQFPISWILRDIFQVSEVSKYHRCRFCSPAGNSGISICRITDNSQPIGNRLWTDTKLFYNTLLINNKLTPSVPADDTISRNYLGEIFIR